MYDDLAFLLPIFVFLCLTRIFIKMEDRDYLHRNYTLHKGRQRGSDGDKTTSSTS